MRPGFDKMDTLMRCEHTQLTRDGICCFPEPSAEHILMHAFREKPATFVSRRAACTCDDNATDPTRCASIVPR